jgi:hypothetical protein
VGVAGATDVVVEVRPGEDVVVATAERLVDPTAAGLSLLAALPAHPVAITVRTARPRTTPDKGRFVM